MTINKRSWRLLLITLLIVFSSMTRIALAAENNYMVWAPKDNVQVDKIWNIKFNNSLDKTTMYDNIKIIKENTNEVVETNLNYDTINKSISIKPLKKYEYNSSYILLIDSGIKTEKGLSIVKPIKLKFKTQSLINNSLLKEKFDDPGTIISSSEDFCNALRYGLANFKSQLKLTINNYNSEDYRLDFINEIINENPLLDYGYAGASASIIYGKMNSATMTINLKYEYSNEYMENMRKASQNKAAEIISGIIKPGMTDYEKELAIHNYIVNNAKYDTRLYNGDMPNESYLDYGVLVKGTGVCDSYARTMYRLLNTAGIQCIYVTGDAYDGNDIIPHAWNIVKIENKYYQLDTTWDDPVVIGGGDMLSYSYFNVTDEKLSEDHIWDRSKYPKCYDTKFNFIRNAK